MSHVESIYKINTGIITETELDLILMALSHFLSSAQKHKELKEFETRTENLLNKIVGKL